MNNSDEVVGYVGRNNSPVPRGGSGAITVIAGFLYSGGKLYDLNKLLTPASKGWHISEGRGIDDSGSIVALASRPGMRLVPVFLRRVSN